MGGYNLEIPDTAAVLFLPKNKVLAVALEPG